MQNFKQYLTESTTVPLRTINGSRIGRSTKYGVGKTMGGDTWVHKNYMDKVIPSVILKNALRLLPKDFKYNTVKYTPSTGMIRFEVGENFDTAREPFAGACIKVASNGDVIPDKSNSIYHHKWMWVLDDYTGFDVQASYDWSKYYLEVLKIVPKGGSQRVWDEQLLNAGYK